MSWFNHLSRLSHLSWGKFHQTHGERREVLPEFSTKIPHPWRDDLPAVLTAGRARDPTVWLLLLIFVRQDGLERPAMQIHMEHI